MCRSDLVEDKVVLLFPDIPGSGSENLKEKPTRVVFLCPFSGLNPRGARSVRYSKFFPTILAKRASKYQVFNGLFIPHHA